jgi:hypothetical protein
MKGLDVQRVREPACALVKGCFELMNTAFTELFAGPNANLPVPKAGQAFADWSWPLQANGRSTKVALQALFNEAESTGLATTTWLLRLGQEAGVRDGDLTIWPDTYDPGVFWALFKPRTQEATGLAQYWRAIASRLPVAEWTATGECLEATEPFRQLVQTSSTGRASTFTADAPLTWPAWLKAEALQQAATTRRLVALSAQPSGNGDYSGWIFPLINEHREATYLVVLHPITLTLEPTPPEPVHVPIPDPETLGLLQRTQDELTFARQSIQELIYQLSLSEDLAFDLRNQVLERDRQLESLGAGQRNSWHQALEALTRLPAPTDKRPGFDRIPQAYKNSYQKSVQLNQELHQTLAETQQMLLSYNEILRLLHMQGTQLWVTNPQDRTGFSLNTAEPRTLPVEQIVDGLPESLQPNTRAWLLTDESRVSNEPYHQQTEDAELYIWPLKTLQLEYPLFFWTCRTMPHAVESVAPDPVGWVNDVLHQVKPEARRRSIALLLNIAPDVPDHIPGLTGSLRQTTVRVLRQLLEQTQGSKIVMTLLRSGFDEIQLRLDTDRSPRLEATTWPENWHAYPQGERQFRISYTLVLK